MLITEKLFIFHQALNLIIKQTVEQQPKCPMINAFSNARGNNAPNISGAV